MPATTSIGSYTLSNLGPLTTTFTPAPSCSTQYLGLEINEIYNLGEDLSSNFSTSITTDFYYGTPCGVPYASLSGCLPSGGLLDSHYNSVTSSLSGRPFTQAEVAYYSPASICPYGYETVGAATKLSGGNVSSSGAAFVLSSTSPDIIEFSDLRNPPPNVLLEAMLEGEQAILCCPSGYGVNTDGVCKSTIPSYPIPSEVCVEVINDQDIVAPEPTVTLTIYGSVYTGEELSISGTAPVSTWTREVASATASGPGQGLGFVAVDVMEVLYLVHGGSDSASASSRATGDKVGLSVVLVFFTLTLAFTSGFMLLIM